MSIKSFYLKLIRAICLGSVVFWAFTTVLYPAHNQSSKSELAVGISAENPLYDIIFTAE